MLNYSFNFIPRLDSILPEIKKIDLYNAKDFNKITKLKDNWPGFRSLPLEESNIILYDYINSLIFNKNFLEKGVYSISSFIHLRLEEDNDKDWIHQDNHDWAGLVYLSETNYNSGTHIYDNNKNMVIDLKFVKNSCVFYPGNYYHKGYGHHGQNIENGRLTLNLFMDKK